MSKIVFVLLVAAAAFVMSEANILDPQSIIGTVGSIVPSSQGAGSLIPIIPKTNGPTNVVTGVLLVIQKLIGGLLRLDGGDSAALGPLNVFLLLINGIEL